MFTLKGQQFFSTMCQHGMEHEGLWRPSPFGFAFILHAEGVHGVTTSVGGLYFKACYYYR
jgi:hypothetical protein